MPADPRSWSQYRTSRRNDAPTAPQAAHIGTYALVAPDAQIAGYVRFSGVRSLSVMCAVVRDVLGLFANVGQLSLVVDGFGFWLVGCYVDAGFVLLAPVASKDGFGALRSKPETRSDLRRLPNGLALA
jgi:hypothetical protein